MKIAFLSTILSYPLGGADTLWVRAAEAAGNRGDRLLLSVSPAVAAHSRLAALIGTGAEIELRDPPPPGRSLKRRVLDKLGWRARPDGPLIASLTRFRPDLIVISQGGTYDLILHPEVVTWIRANRVKYRIVANWQQENPQLDPAQMTFVRDAFSGATRICFVSTRNLEVTVRHLGRQLPNAAVVHNPLRWQPSDLRPWPQATRLRIATVSRLEESKGIQVLLAALRNLPPGGPDWELNIFGLGLFEKNLRLLAAECGLAERVKFRGYVSDLGAIWGENHLMVSPALDEGVPMTIPEAMLCQRPVLATQVGGAADWLQPEVTGFLCPAPVLSALVPALTGALAAHERWPTMGLAAAKSAVRHYRPDDYLQLIN